MGPLAAVGGISIADQSTRSLEAALDAICKEFGFPKGEAFKWSPSKDHWMRDGLIDQRRTAFLHNVLSAAAEHDAVGLVVASDTTKRMATRQAVNHEQDVLVMALERFDASLPLKESGIVIVARPSGGRSDEDKFLADCAQIVTRGTNYSAFRHLATKVLTMPAANSRLLQLADVVVSVTVAMIAGHDRFAGQVFPSVRKVLRQQSFRCGGVGVKIHPDSIYRNLYHWVLGDEVFWSAGVGITLPLSNWPFAVNGFEH